MASFSTMSLTAQLAELNEQTEYMLQRAQDGELVDALPLQQLVQDVCKALPEYEGSDKGLVSETLQDIIQRFDELCECLKERQQALGMDIRATTNHTQAAKAYLNASKK